MRFKLNEEGHRHWRGTFRRYLSNVFWHVWGTGSRGIEMRDLCRSQRSFISLLWCECTLRWVKNKPTYKQIQIIQRMRVGYLDIHSKQHLNHAVLSGPHPLLIETQVVADNLICLRNGGDINSTWLQQWPLLLFVLNLSKHFIIPSLSGEPLRTVSLSPLFSCVSLAPFLSLSAAWYKHPGSRQEHHQHAQCAGVMQIASVLVMEGTAIDREQEMAAAQEALFGLA